MDSFPDHITRQNVNKELAKCQQTLLRETRNEFVRLIEFNTQNSNPTSILVFDSRLAQKSRRTIVKELHKGFGHFNIKYILGHGRITKQFSPGEKLPREIVSIEIVCDVDGEK